LVKITELFLELLEKTKNTKIAIENTSKILDNNEIWNITVKNESHYLFDIYVNELFNIAIYNLGYLPCEDKSIEIEAYKLIASLKKAISLFTYDGRIVIVIYLHDRLESLSIESFYQS